MELMGGESADKANFLKVMRSGDDFAIIPGGVEEVVLGDPHKERIYIKARKGFVKYALQMGYDLVPIYHFGETQLYDILWPWNTDWMVKLRLKFAQKTQIALGIGIGCRFAWNLPKRGQKCITAYGDRVELPKIESPTSEDVEKYQALYI